MVEVVYFVFIDESKIVGCFLLDYVISVFFIVNVKLFKE